MGPREKLRSLRNKFRTEPPVRHSAGPSSPSQPSPPVPSAAFSPPSSSPIPSAPRVLTNSQNSAPSTASTPVAAPSCAPASIIFPVMQLVKNPNAVTLSSPQRVHVSVSSDLRLIDADLRPTSPSSLLDFRNPTCRLELKRMHNEPPPQQSSSPVPSQDLIVAPRAQSVNHPAGPAVRIADAQHTIVIIASSEEQRGALLLALLLRLAPWVVLREQMEVEMRYALSSPSTASSVADAALDFLSGVGVSHRETSSASDSREMRTMGMARRLWEKAGAMAELSIWTATFGQGLGSVARTAEGLEQLAKPLGGLTVVGCAFSLVALSARVVHLMAMEREGREGLVEAQNDLKEASVALVSWLFSILGSGFQDEDDLLGKVFDALCECWNAADELEQYLLRSWVMRTWTAEDFEAIVAKVDSVKGKLLGAGLLNVVAKHERRIGNLEAKALTVDAFIAYAPDPCETTAGLEEEAAICLAPIKAAVLATCPLDESTTALPSNISYSGSSFLRVALTSISGEGGVGKTSTCRLLCADESVRAHFLHGAILWIDVGQAATEEKVMSELRKAVSRCGGNRAAESIRSSSDIFEAVDIARVFLSGRRLLVVIDNVWETPSSSTVRSWAETLSKIANCPGSSIIVTTRFTSLSLIPGFSCLKLGRLDLTTQNSPDWQIAERLFDVLLNAPLEVQSTDIYKLNRKTALELSCGLALGIKTIVGVVRYRLQICDDVGSVLTKIRKRAIGLADKYVGEDLNATIGHPGLFAAMESSLAFLDERKGCRLKSAPLAEIRDADGEDARLFHASYVNFIDQPLRSRYAALEVMQASSKHLSFPVLCRLWHMRNTEQAEEIALLFVNIGLGRIEEIYPGREKVFCIHDLQYEFCLGMHGTSTGATTGVSDNDPAHLNGHALLLSSSESLAGSQEAMKNAGMGWVPFCFQEGLGLLHPVLRRYLAQNLFRHLCAVAEGAGIAKVLGAGLNLLADFRWLRGRVVADGRASAVSDCSSALELCLSAASTCSTQVLIGSTERTIRALQQSLMLVGAPKRLDVMTMGSDGMLATSLIHLARSPVDRPDDDLDAAFLEKLAKSVENEVCGPWIKPFYGCRRELYKCVVSQAVVGSGACAPSIFALGDGVHFVSVTADGMVRVHECEYLEAILEVMSTDVGYCIDVTRSDRFEGTTCFLFSGSSDGTVRLDWELGLDPCQPCTRKVDVIVGDCESPISCLTVSHGGSRVAAGCRNGVVHIWKRRDGDEGLLYELVTRFSCFSAADGGDKSPWLVGLVISRLGDLVVAAVMDRGEKKGTAACWSNIGTEMGGGVDRVSFICEDQAESGMPGVYNPALLHSVLLSDDESCFYATFNYPAAYEVWDIPSRSAISPRVALPEFKVITCASIRSGQNTRGGRSTSRDCLLVAGWDMSRRNQLVEYLIERERSTLNDRTVTMLRYPVTSVPRSVCTAFLSGKMIHVTGCDDGRVRLLMAGASASFSGDATKLSQEDADERGTGLDSYRAGLQDADERGTGLDSDRAGLQEYALQPVNQVSAVAVMPTSGLVVSGHRNGRLSLWRAKSGDFVTILGDHLADDVLCIDVSENERVVVSGHRNKCALVWDTESWRCLFVLKGHSFSVYCAAIDSYANQIVTVDRGGELRIWDATNGGAAVWSVKTGLMFSFSGAHGAISVDGGLFFWATDGDHDSHTAGRSGAKWDGKVIDLTRREILFESEACYSDLGSLLEKMHLFMTSRCYRGGHARVETQWRIGAMALNRLVELPLAGSDVPADMWIVSSGTEGGGLIPRVKFDMRYANETISAETDLVSLDFDCTVRSIAARWVPSTAGDRLHAVVACSLGQRVPAILHFIPGKG